MMVVAAAVPIPEGPSGARYRAPTAGLACDLGGPVPPGLTDDGPGLWPVGSTATPHVHCRGPRSLAREVHPPGYHGTMCFDVDSRPPIDPVSGAAVDHRALDLESTDGERVMAFARLASSPSTAGILVLPDVRGLHGYYEELCLRFAEAGIDALAIDYFGRTAETRDRGADFPFQEHVARTTWAGNKSDIRAGARWLRDERGVERLFSVGFCFGGRLSFLAATLDDVALAGAIGFYGWPVGRGRNDSPPPAESADRMGCPVLGLFGGADQAIPPEAVAAFEMALTAAGVQNEIVTYPDAPHSFFDRKQADFQAESTAAWERTLAFIRAGDEPARASHA